MFAIKPDEETLAWEKECRIAERKKLAYDTVIDLNREDPLFHRVLADTYEEWIQSGHQPISASSLERMLETFVDYYSGVGLMRTIIPVETVMCRYPRSRRLDRIGRFVKFHDRLITRLYQVGYAVFCDIEDKPIDSPFILHETLAIAKEFFLNHPEFICMEDVTELEFGREPIVIGRQMYSTELRVKLVVVSDKEKGFEPFVSVSFMDTAQALGMFYDNKHNPLAWKIAEKERIKVKKELPNELESAKALRKEVNDFLTSEYESIKKKRVVYLQHQAQRLISRNYLKGNNIHADRWTEVCRVGMNEEGSLSLNLTALTQEQMEGILRLLTPKEQ